MSTVFIRRAAYDSPSLSAAVTEILDSCLGDRTLTGVNALVKPNLLAAAPPEAAVTTHPAVVRAVCEYLVERGASVTVSDSPGVGAFRKIIRTTGLEGALRDLPLSFAEFERKAAAEGKGHFKKIELAAGALEADLIINLPKLKTHSQMGLTLGVKNLFGCVVGMEKPRWHFRTGVDIEMFARLLIEIHNILRPAVTIIDGILAMEGQGPGKRGTPRELGILAGSSDTFALDFTVSRMVGIDPLSVPVNRVAHSMGLTGEISIDGDLPEVHDFAMPRMMDLIFGPSFMHGFMRRHLTMRPVEERERCRMCLECISHCPVDAITTKGDRLHFDYDKCIRCYCCVEICPHAAMKSTRPLLGRLVFSFRK